MSPIDILNRNHHTAVNGDSEDLVDVMAHSDPFSYEDIPASGIHRGSDTMSNDEGLYTPSTMSNSQVVYTPSSASEEIVRKEYLDDDYNLAEAEPLLQASPPPCYRDNPSDLPAQASQVGQAGKPGQG